MPLVKLRWNIWESGTLISAAINLINLRLSPSISQLAFELKDLIISMICPGTVLLKLSWGTFSTLGMYDSGVLSAGCTESDISFPTVEKKLLKLLAISNLLEVVLPFTVNFSIDIFSDFPVDSSFKIDHSFLGFF
jgi:hypothetical protein